MLQGTWRPSVLAAALALVLAMPAQGRPPHKQALADHFGSFLARSLHDCRTCHVPEKPGTSAAEPEERPHNPFGARLRAVRDELRNAGQKTTIPARLEAIAAEDSDGDGAANLVELLTGHNPGEPGDRPSAAELAASGQTLAAFRKARSAYPWTPFEVVRRPALPTVRNAGWVRNPIDAFIAQAHEERGLAPRPEAPRAVLLRRVYLDLIGLPPTPEELHAFLADTSSDAYEKVVDRLLASPQYGERWGRHWMDVWRYSDWAGYGQQVRDSQPHIWRWRDWIIESLNADKGYDRMILEMLAADELAPEDTDALRATGYLVRNFKLLSREKWMQDVVDHTAQAFLGVTLGCARCHDHMYDPITQKEYYQVRAIFEPHKVRIDRVPGQLDTAKDGLPRAYDADLDGKTFLFVRGDERTPDKTPLPPGVPEALGGRFPAVTPVSLPPAAVAPDRRAFVVAETLAASAASAAQARATRESARQAAAPLLVPLVGEQPLRIVTRLAASGKAVDAWLLAELDTPLAEVKHAALAATVQAEQLEDQGKKDSEAWRQAATEAAALQRRQAVLEARRNLVAAQQAQRSGPAKARADAAKKAAEAEKALATALADAQQPATTAYTRRPITTYPATSTGRRLAFARWIADRSHPLTARVAMNQVWLRHFGQAIVPSVFDFGRNGKPPTHPALLDWLAAEFMERNWSLKAMHRLLVTSSTYRQASTPDPRNLALDPDNRYLWRTTPRRVEAEVVRDCIFHVAGTLDRTLGGPEIDHQRGLTVARRSVYFRHASEKQMEFLKLFDCAAVTECYQRKESILPQQALALANSELTLRQARLLAEALAARVPPGPEAFTTAAFERVLSRPPTVEELKECALFLEAQTRRLGPSGAERRAQEMLVHVLLNHHDFVTIR